MWYRDRDLMAPFGELRREMDRLLDSFVGGVERGLPFRGRGYPAVNVWEDQECLYAEAEVPGLSMNDLEVQVVGSELCIKGERKAADQADITYHRRERGLGEFARFLTLPVEVNAAKVEAVLKDGLLTITLPKSDAAKVRRINVKPE